MKSQEKGNLTRARNAMPEYIEKSLLQHGLAQAYFDRPAYQQNDYIGWIERAVRADTRKKRLDQMLDELRRGGVYMKMKHRPSRRD